MTILEKAKRAGQIAQQIETLTAELAALFGEDTLAPEKPTEVQPAPVAPDPEPTPEPAPPVRRGRPPGSKNKPKDSEVKDPEVKAEPAAAPADDLPWGDAQTSQHIISGGVTASLPKAEEPTPASDDFTTF